MEAKFSARATPPWLADLLGRTIPVSLILYLFVIVAVIVLLARGRSAKRELVQKGYAWAKLYDGLWLSLTLGRGFSLIPPAEEAGVLPGYAETADSLVAIVRMRKQ